MLNSRKNDAGQKQNPLVKGNTLMHLEELIQLHIKYNEKLIFSLLQMNGNADRIENVSTVKYEKVVLCTICFRRIARRICFPSPTLKIVSNWTIH